MKLSEAIRLGAMMASQSFKTSLADDGSTCALGAALMAIGKATTSYTNAFDHFPATYQQVNYPISGENMLLLSAIRNLNDDAHWTREQIGEWVATVEQAEVPEPQPQVETPALITA